jgi:hypothetical protein
MWFILSKSLAESDPNNSRIDKEQNHAMRILPRSLAIRIGAYSLLALLGTIMSSRPASASVLLSAPSANSSFYGMYCVSCAGVSFTLTGSYNVSTIDVVLTAPASTTFTTIDFSLMTSATVSIDTQAVTVPLNAISTEVINVNETLSAGTYYLIANVPGYIETTVTPGVVDGWMMSTGVYNQAAGTIANGVGNFQGNTWELNTTPGDFAPAFTVNGSLAPPTPEPSAIFLMLGGLAALIGLAAKRKIIRIG